jgi:hypothetical protein
MPPVDNIVEKVDLFLTGKSIAKLHTFNLTDAFAVLYQSEPNGQLTKLGSTELIRDSRDPTWTKVFAVDYLFETVQDMVVKVFQEEGGHPVTDESKHSLIGQARFRLSDLMCAQSQTVGLSLQHPQQGGARGTVDVRGEARTNTRDLFVVAFSGNKLANKDGFFGRSDPFLVVSRLNEDGTWTVVWKSVRIDNNLSPRWAAVKIPMTTLCNGDIDRPLKIEIFDYNENSKHVSMGAVETSVRAMVTGGGAPMNVIEADKKSKKGYVNSGTLVAGSCVIEQYPTLSDFIMGGLEISMLVAIDFTGSNGDPKTPSSLHYLDASGRLNQYQDAITAVGNVVQSYDSDKKFPVYGFGARCQQPDGSFSPVQHCFPVYGGGFEVDGVDGILQAYKDVVHNVMFSGPTLFAPLISTATQHAIERQCTQQHQTYDVLLILTDGVINDMDATKAALITASQHPISVIIVGVGAADFTDMNALDSDGKLLSHNGRTATRDIVQFVSFKDFVVAGGGALAQCVLAEIPAQLLQYMQQNAIKPNPKK